MSCSCSCTTTTTYNNNNNNNNMTPIGGDGGGGRDAKCCATCASWAANWSEKLMAAASESRIVAWSDRRTVRVDPLLTMYMCHVVICVSCYMTKHVMLSYVYSCYMTNTCTCNNMYMYMLHVCTCYMYVVVCCCCNMHNMYMLYMLQATRGFM